MVTRLDTVMGGMVAAISSLACGVDAAALMMWLVSDWPLAVCCCSLLADQSIAHALSAS